MKKIIIGAVIFLLMVTVGLSVLSVVVYRQNFAKRFETTEPIARVDDFKNLKAEKLEFTSKSLSLRIMVN